MIPSLDNPSDSLLFIGLFPQLNQAQIMGKYVSKRFSPKHPMYSLLMCLTEQEESHILISDEIMSQIDWKIQIGIIIKHIDILQADKVNRIRKYIGRFAYWLLENQNDIWAFITLNLVIGNWSTADIYSNPNF